MSHNNQQQDKKHAKVPEEKQDKHDKNNIHQLGKNKAEHVNLAEGLGEYADICKNVNKNFIRKEQDEDIE